MKTFSLALIVFLSATSAFAEKCVDQTNSGNTCEVKITNEGNLTLVLPNGRSQEWRITQESRDGVEATLVNDTYEPFGNCLGKNITQRELAEGFSIFTSVQGVERGSPDSYTLLCK